MTPSNRFRHPKDKNAVATRNDQLLISAGASKRSFAWFNKMGVSNAYSTKIAKSGDFGKGYDAEALRWKTEIEKNYGEIKTIQKDKACSFKEATEIQRLTNPLPFLYKVPFSFILLFIPLRTTALRLH